ncbi:hypothetical protein [Chromatium okenii]|nr:hypothetical protein [Chromatium okenii]
MLADDNRANQDLIALYLRRCGLQVKLQKMVRSSEKAQQISI